MLPRCRIYIMHAAVQMSCTTLLPSTVQAHTPPTACLPSLQGLNGIAQLVAALPAGFLADRHRRDTLLRAGALVGAAAGGLLAAALAWRPTVPMLAAASALLGCYSGTYNAALEALFADSVPPGRRWAACVCLRFGLSRCPGVLVGSTVAGWLAAEMWERLLAIIPGQPASLPHPAARPCTCTLCSSPYSRKYAVTVLASSFGPWLSLLLFRRLGNKWDAADCRAVLLCGVALMAVPLTLMLCFDDDKALKHHGQPTEADGLHRQQQESHGQQQQGQAAPNGSCSGGSGSSSAALPSGYEHLPAEPPRDVEEAMGAAATAAAATAAAAAVLTPPAQKPLAAVPSAGSLVGLLDEGPSPAAAAEQEAPCCCASCAGSCCGLPAGVAVTLLITGSDLIGALASGEASVQSCSVLQVDQVQPKGLVRQMECSNCWIRHTADLQPPCPPASCHTPPTACRHDVEILRHVLLPSGGPEPHGRVTSGRPVAAGSQRRCPGLPAAVQAGGARADKASVWRAGRGRCWTGAAVLAAPSSSAVPAMQLVLCMPSCHAALLCLRQSQLPCLACLLHSALAQRTLPHSPSCHAA